MGHAAPALLATRDGWKARVPRAVFSGIAPASRDAYGFHNCANNLIAAGKRNDYSLRDAGNRPSDGIDMDAFDALDMSMIREDMIMATNLIYNSWRDQNDWRLNHWYEFIGTRDGQRVIYMNCQTGQEGTADLSHLTHVHGGLERINAGSLYPAHALLSILDRKSWQQYTAEQPGDPWVIKARTGQAPTPVPAPRPPAPTAPPWPGRYLRNTRPMMRGDDIRQWQAQMSARGWRLTVDGWYGNDSERICRQFQAEKRLGVDGVVGPVTWRAAWTAPVT